MKKIFNFYIIRDIARYYRMTTEKVTKKKIIKIEKKKISLATTSFNFQKKPDFIHFHA